MPHLAQLSLTQFKNYASSQFLFKERIIGITGLNGVGKTNLLDAIHFLCLTKSYFNRVDHASVKQGEKGFRLEGVFERAGRHEVVTCVIRENGKKEISVDQTQLSRKADHIGSYPLIFIAPDDTTLITGESRERRSYLDQLIAQIDSNYLRHLISYNKLIQQRNALLKEMAEKRIGSSTVLEAIDLQLIPVGTYLYELRKKTIEDLTPQILVLHGKIAKSLDKASEEINVQFKSQLDNQSFADILKINLAKDLVMQRTTQGPHRDDILFTMENQTFKTIASQGQRKSLLFSLKLAALHILEHKSESSPLLLLDDLFEKLDDQRVHNLIKLVCQQTVSQVFITDTSVERLESNLKKLNLPYQICSV